MLFCFNYTQLWVCIFFNLQIYQEWGSRTFGIHLSISLFLYHEQIISLLCDEVTRSWTRNVHMFKIITAASSSNDRREAVIVCYFSREKIMAVVTNRYGKNLWVPLSFECFYFDLVAISNYRIAIIKRAADSFILPFTILTNITLNKRQSIY